MSTSTILLPTTLFFLGTIVGSFLGVLIHRYKENEPGIIFGRSHCNHCQKKLAAKDLVPLASFILLKGRSRCCNKKIGKEYFFIEIITGLLFGILSIISPDPATYIFTTFITTIMIAIAWYDGLFQEIPDIFSITGIILALIGNLLLGKIPINEIGIGALIGFLFFQIQYTISKGKWIGGGDIFLGIFMGISLGWKNLLVALFFAYIIGAIVGLALMLKKKADRKTAIAFGPFLMAGTIFAMFFGNDIVHWYGNML